MLKIKEYKLLNVLRIKKQGLSQADAARITGYSNALVCSVYNDNYETISLMPPEQWDYKERKAGSAVWITKHDYNLRDTDVLQIPYENVEDIYIRKEEAERLHNALSILTVRDREIIQAKADGQSDRQIIDEYSTSAGHIRAIQKKLQGKLK